MAITDYDSYISKINSPSERIIGFKGSSTVPATRTNSLWTAAGTSTGFAPPSAAACDRTTTGAIGQRNSASTLRLPRATIATTADRPNCYFLCDRLSHQGGLSGTDTTAQTTNLPTAALTRDTTGAGVMAALEIYTTVGTTATTATVSYTNQAGTAGKTSPDVTFGSTAFREAGRFLILPLAAGDTGVRSVESVTLAATTGTAGNFGVTLFRPLMAFPHMTVHNNPQVHDAILGNGCALPAIPADACLFWVIVAYSTTAGNVTIDMTFVED